MQSLSVSHFLDHHLIAYPDLPSVDHPGKHALSRHDAVTHLLKYLTAVVAFLSDLCQLQHHVVAAESCPNGQVLKIKSADHQILTECAVRHLSAPVSEILYLFITQKTYLTVPFSRMRVFFNAKIFYKAGLLNVLFLKSSIFS